MHVTFVTPHVGRKDPNDVARYVRTWQMEPLPMAVLAGLTPDGVGRTLLDERVERIDLDAPTDLAAIAIETYTAKRGYEIAAEYRRRGVPVILGGYHAMLMPDEASRYADSVMVSHAEHVWLDVLRDAEHGRLQRRYDGSGRGPMRFGRPDRSIYAGRNYLPVSCVETGRGCPLHCSFCSIMASTRSHYSPRPIAEVIADVETTGRREVFFIDDNVLGDPRWAREFFRALAPLKIRWFSQSTLRLAADPETLDLMAASGCLGVLIGFESFKADTLRAMRKDVNVRLLDDVRTSVRAIHARGIAIYGAFIFGYDTDTLADYRAIADAALELDLFMAAFNPLIPFPGTPLYEQLRSEGRVREQWWLDPSFRFGEVPYLPKHSTADEVSAACIAARRRFYGVPSILKRCRNVRGNIGDPRKLLGYLGINLQLGRETVEREGLPLGNAPVRPEEAFHDPDLLVPARHGGG